MESKRSPAAMDMLVDMFEKQAAMQRRMGFNHAEMSPEERTAYIKEYTLHCTHEMHEMLQKLPYFKAWKRYNDTEIHYEVLEELIDAWHMFMNVALALGLTADQFYDIYTYKNNVNHQRQDNTAEYKPCKE